MVKIVKMPEKKSSLKISSKTLRAYISSYFPLDVLVEKIPLIKQSILITEDITK